MELAVRREGVTHGDGGAMAIFGLQVRISGQSRLKMKDLGILEYHKNHVIWKIHYKDIPVSPWINLMKLVNEVRMLTENYPLDSQSTLCNLQVTDDSPVFRVRGYGQSLLFESLLLEEVSNTGPGKKKKKNINLLKINNN